MAKIHFVNVKEGNILPPNRVTLTNRGSSRERDGYFGRFERAVYFEDDERIFTVYNCSGSLVCEQPQRQGWNKLHAGEHLAVRNPHVEDYGTKDLGPRFDLHGIDAKYALARRNELIMWRDPEYRAELGTRYDDKTWKGAEIRRAQLGISRSGLDNQIQALQDLYTKLRDLGSDGKFISDQVSMIEIKVRTLMEELNERFPEIDKERAALPRKERIVPPIVEAPSVIFGMNSIGTDVANLLDFVDAQVDIEDCRNYWDEVAAWEHL